MNLSLDSINALILKDYVLRLFVYLQWEQLNIGNRNVKSRNVAASYYRFNPTNSDL